MKSRTSCNMHEAILTAFIISSLIRRAPRWQSAAGSGKLEWKMPLAFGGAYAVQKTPNAAL
jgi:hypothetical protein